MSARRGILLITGGSGFVGGWCVVRALAAGWRVRATIRDRTREAKVRAWLAPHIASGERLSFHVADLLSDAGWAEAIQGCRAVLHVASPFPARMPKEADDLIIPARDGTLRVLKAAKNAGVKRIVITSSLAAASIPSEEAVDEFTLVRRAARGLIARFTGVPRDLAEPQKIEPHVVTEADWSDPKSALASAYARSKVIAERAAWDWVARFSPGMQLTSILPGAVLGPVLGPDLPSSAIIVRMLLEGALPACPRISLPIVDVRDVADLHLRALDASAAIGERFIAASTPPLWLDDIARILKTNLNGAAKRVPSRSAPDWMVRAAAFISPTLQAALPSLGRTQRLSNEKARATLGWTPRPAEETILAFAESLMALSGRRAEEAHAA